MHQFWNQLFNWIWLLMSWTCDFVSIPKLFFDILYESKCNQKQKQKKTNRWCKLNTYDSLKFIHFFFTFFSMQIWERKKRIAIFDRTHQTRIWPGYCKKVRKKKKSSAYTVHRKQTRKRKRKSLQFFCIQFFFCVCGFKSNLLLLFQRVYNAYSCSFPRITTCMAICFFVYWGWSCCFCWV